jgi:crotonobetainyl-CoA:carnitine CoA-transferase CaiB-like acyl-CoA transferase
VAFERAPYLGEHTDQILAEDLDLDEESISKLRAAKVVS